MKNKIVKEISHKKHRRKRNLRKLAVASSLVFGACNAGGRMGKKDICSIGDLLEKSKMISFTHDDTNFKKANLNDGDTYKFEKEDDSNNNYVFKDDTSNTKISISKTAFENTELYKEITTQLALNHQDFLKKYFYKRKNKKIEADDLKDGESIKKLHDAKFQMLRIKSGESPINFTKRKWPYKVVYSATTWWGLLAIGNGIMGFGSLMAGTNYIATFYSAIGAGLKAAIASIGSLVSYVTKGLSLGLVSKSTVLVALSGFTLVGLIIGVSIITGLVIYELYKSAAFKSLVKWFRGNNKWEKFKKGFKNLLLWRPFAPSDTV